MKISLLRLLTATICVLVQSTLCCGTNAADASNVERLAILASKDVHQAGLDDLVMVELQSIKGVELVERDMLDKVLKEMKISTVLGAGQTSKRVKLGRLLRADKLVFLSFEKDLMIKGNSVQVIISDCSNGARLRVGWVGLKKGFSEETGKEIAAMIRETLDRFSEGVDQIVGTSDFRSLTLVHSYDYLQAKYSHLLANALSSAKGIAVLETQEARAIQRENALAQGERTKRVVPLFVWGEFKVNDSVSGKAIRIDVNVQIMGTSGEIAQISRKGLSAADAEKFVSKEASQKVLEVLRGPNQEFDIEKQYKALRVRASKFTDVAAHDEAFRLHETAMLLTLENLTPGVLLDRTVLNTLSKLKKDYKRRKDFKAARDIFAYLVKNRNLRMRDATSYTNIFAGVSRELRIVEDILPAMRQLDGFEERRLYSCYCMLVRESDWHTKEGLADIVRFHEEHVPRDLRPEQNFLYVLNNYSQRDWPDKNSTLYQDQNVNITEKEFVSFLNALAMSRHDLCNLYGRYSLLQRKFKQYQFRGYAMDDLSIEVSKFLDEVEQRFVGEKPVNADKDTNRMTPSLKLLINRIDEYNLAMGVDASGDDSNSLTQPPAQKITGRVIFELVMSIQKRAS